MIEIPQITTAAFMQSNVLKLMWHLSLYTNAVAQLDYVAIKKNGGQMEQAIWSILPSFKLGSHEEKHLTKMLELTKILKTSFEGDALFLGGITPFGKCTDDNKKERYTENLRLFLSHANAMKVTELSDTQEADVNIIDLHFKLLLHQERDKTTRAFYCDSIVSQLIALMHQLRTLPVHEATPETRKYFTHLIKRAIERVNQCKLEDRDGEFRKKMNEAYSMFSELLTFGVILKTSRASVDKGGEADFTPDDLQSLFVPTKSALPKTEEARTLQRKEKMARLKKYMQVLFDGEHNSSESAVMNQDFMGMFPDIKEATFRADVVTTLINKKKWLKSQKRSDNRAYYWLTKSGLTALDSWDNM